MMIKNIIGYIDDAVSPKITQIPIMLLALLWFALVSMILAEAYLCYAFYLWLQNECLYTTWQASLITAIGVSIKVIFLLCYVRFMLKKLTPANIIADKLGLGKKLLFAFVRGFNSK
jgi:hypothetical protein